MFSAKSFTIKVSICVSVRSKNSINLNIKMFSTLLISKIFHVTGFSGGYVYIYHSPEMPYAWKNDDGYHWSEILHQMDMLTAKGKKDKR